MREEGMMYLPEWAKRIGRMKTEALPEIHQQKAVFEDAVSTAQGAGVTSNQTFVDSVLIRFTQIESELNEAKTSSQINGLKCRANELSRLKAYVCPPGEIVLSGKIALSTMEAWSVPQSALESLKNESNAPLSNADLNTARGALYTVLKEYDSWDTYIDDYNADMRRVTYLLAGLFLLSLVGIIWSLNYDVMLLSLLFAGAGGALVSVVSKVPTLNVYGDDAPYMRGIWKRVCMGLAASVIGIGFLASGFITVTIPNAVSLHEMIKTCTRLPMLENAAASKSEVASESTQIAAVKPREVTAACETWEKLILVALVMLFGFSERALTSFEERVFPAKP